MLQTSDIGNWTPKRNDRQFVQVCSIELLAIIKSVCISCKSCRRSCKSCKKSSMLQTSNIGNWGIVGKKRKKATLLALLLDFICDFKATPPIGAGGQSDKLWGKSHTSQICCSAAKISFFWWADLCSHNYHKTLSMSSAKQFSYNFYSCFWSVIISSIVISSVQMQVQYVFHTQQFIQI
jgi:ferredoxin